MLTKTEIVSTGKCTENTKTLLRSLEGKACLYNIGSKCNNVNEKNYSWKAVKSVVPDVKCMQDIILSYGS